MTKKKMVKKGIASKKVTKKEKREIVTDFLCDLEASVIEYVDEIFGMSEDAFDFGTFSGEMEDMIIEEMNDTHMQMGPKTMEALVKYMIAETKMALESLSIPSDCCYHINPGSDDTAEQIMARAYAGRLRYAIENNIPIHVNENTAEIVPPFPKGDFRKAVFSQ
jgi:hypothetical protein